MILFLNGFWQYCRRILDLLEEKTPSKRNLRVPAISRLQKIHNMDVVFAVLRDLGINMETDGIYSGKRNFWYLIN